MGLVKIRVPRTSQPQDTCGIDWSNPITQNLIVVVLAGCNLELVSGVPLTNYPSNGVGKNGRHLSQSALDATQMFLGRAVSIPAGSDITGFAVLNESVLRTNNNHGFWRSSNNSSPFFLLQSNTGLPYIRVSSDVLKPTSGPSIDFTAPDNRIFFRLKSSAWADYGFDGKSVNYATHAQATPACIVTSIGTHFGVQNALGNAPLLLMFRRTLSDDDVKSLTDNPWQIFEPEEITIWVPGEVGAGGTDHLVTPANSQQINTASTGAITQTHLIGAAHSTQANVGTAGSVSQGSITQVTAANSTQPNTASAGGISQTHLIVCAPVAMDNVASASSIVQTHLIGAANSVQGNVASGASVSDGSAAAFVAAADFGVVPYELRTGHVPFEDRVGIVPFESRTGVLQ